ncbi:MAG: helix-turn-helix transcriptional regulator [Granulosicoccus sp.]|nr:helix-turn-helix transcriptional regulator [Granulosicoccus sp.]
MTTPVDTLPYPGIDRENADRQLSAFLTVPQLAELLHVNEKKIYQLAGLGEIPGTKVTGKWIFPRRLIEDWLLENSHGGVMHDRLLIAGSDDRLVHQLCSRVAIDWQQHALLSYSPAGTRHGLRMLDSGRIDACFMHWGATEESARRHMGLLRCYRNHQSWVIVRCLQRSQGLLLSRSLAHRLNGSCGNTVSGLISDRSLRWARRQSDSGTERLLEDMCLTEGREMTELQVSTQCNSDISAAAAVNTGHADICCGLHSTAADFGLPYLAVTDVSLDLVMTRKTYFRTLVQEFLNRLQDTETHALSASLGGYSLLPNAQLVTID